MDNGIKDIVSKLDKMCYLNIMSFSVLSGSGIRISPNLHELDTIEELCYDMPPNQKPYNIGFMRSLYKSCLPIYAREVVNPYDMDGYQWVDKKKKKTFDISVLAYSIINCCNLIERILTNKIPVQHSPFLTFLLFRTAEHQGKFIKDHLKVGDIYYTGEETSEQSDKDPRIQIAGKEPDMHSQLLVMQAFAALRHVSAFNIPYLQVDAEGFDEDLDLLPHLYENILEHMKNIKSRNLVNIGLCIAGIYMQNPIFRKNEHYMLANISAELMQRQNENGSIARTPEDVEGSSVRTAFHSLNLFSQLYYMFEYQPYLQASLKTYESLDKLWDLEYGIFKMKDKNKQTYSIKDLSAIISALLSFYCIAPDTKLSSKVNAQITGFFDKAFEKSPIFMAQTRPIFELDMLKLKEDFEGMASKAPVFNKSFEYKISKNKYYCDAEVFRADQVLSSCCFLLNNLSSCCM